MICLHCSEEILRGDDVAEFNGGEKMHRDCALRSVIGSVAHIQKRCSCFVRGAEETDPPELTKRQAAKLAVELWQEQQRKERSHE